MERSFDCTEPSAAPQGEQPSDAKAKKPFSEAFDWMSSLVYAVLFMLALNLFVFRSITVDGLSMYSTLDDQDKVISTNFLYTPDYGDIVVIQADKILNQGTGLYGEPIIKRVIGLAGDTISFDFDKGEVYRNGELLDEDYIEQPTYLNELCYSGVDYVVPENCVFVMGDNRNVSRDSRDLQAVGFVDTDLIMGKAFLRIYPLDKIGLL